LFFGGRGVGELTFIHSVPRSGKIAQKNKCCTPKDTEAWKSLKRNKCFNEGNLQTIQSKEKVGGALVYM
jgi:hypothetical protein